MNFGMKALFGLVFLAAVFVEPSSAVASAAIHRGDMEVSGEVDLHFPQQGDNSFFMNPALKYFFRDRVSAGGSLRLFTQGPVSNTALGPAVDFYFFAENSVAADIGGALLYNHRYDGVNTDTYFSSDIYIGLKWFAVHNVAFGPSFHWNHPFTSTQKDSYDLLAAFAIYF